jgi:pilus assembly protein HofO
MLSGRRSRPFSRLAQRDVQIAAFAIAPQDALLRLRLELEHAK